MLVILMDNQILSSEKICQSCSLATGNGQPRWGGGKLRCGQPINKFTEQQPDQYECVMGFRVANIE